jgi:hypothetical protein
MHNISGLTQPSTAALGNILSRCSHLWLPQIFLSTGRNPIPLGVVDARRAGSKALVEARALMRTWRMGNVSGKGGKRLWLALR